MSTPSTATATLPPHQSYHPHHQPYPSASRYGLISPAAHRARPASSHEGHPSHPPPPPPPQPIEPSYNHTEAYSSFAAPHNAFHPRLPNPYSPAAAAMPPSTTRLASPQSHLNKERRRPDWGEFFKNGIPDEVIVIDDDDSPGPAARTERKPVAQSNGTALKHSTSRQALKKRKTAASNGHEALYHDSVPTYSAHQTPYLDNSSSKNNTISTDRTGSAINTTAATSLGSQVGNGYKLPADTAVVGQKRKRTRKAAADEANEAKRREAELIPSPLEDYVPPPNPPIKAREVNVPVVSDRSANRDKPCDDEDGHYVVIPEADLTEKYSIVRLLGQGTFGKVVEAYDRKKGTRCAIKVIRSVQKYRDASRIELRVLSTLAQNDRGNRNKCIHLRDCFDFKNHICIVTDLFGQSVFDFLKSNQFVPFPNTQIQQFARQLLTSVAFLHDLNLIHTDLKPENILLVNNSYQTFTYGRTIPSSSESSSRSARHRKVLLDPEIRLIDFGSATFNDEYHSSVVSTRHYRAPEIILNLGWSFPCDIWSIGCILVEFFTGDALFQTHDNLEHLAMMEPVCGGKLERDLVRQVVKNDKLKNGNPAAQYFTGTMKLNYPNRDTPKTSKKYVKAMKQLEETIPQHTDFNRSFLDLLRRIFVYNPAKRITAKEALMHPWFRQTMQDDGTEAVKIRISRERSKAEKRTPKLYE